MPVQFLGDDDPLRMSARLRALADHLDRLRDGGAPRPSDLAGAPVLDWWRPAFRQDDALLGLRRDARSAGRTTLTGGLLALDVHGAWALTGDGFCRLGRRADLAGRRRQ